MNEIDSSPLDARLRAALAAEPEVAERLARRALVAPVARRTPWVPLAALLAAVAAVAWLARSAATPRLAAPAELAVSVRIVNHGHVISAVDPRHVSWTADRSLPSPTVPRRLFIVQGGES